MQAPILHGPQIVSLHTVKGVQLYQFLGNELIDVTWTRDTGQVSRCEITIPVSASVEKMPDIVPWLHWISVWDDTGQHLLWTGPVQRRLLSRDRMSIVARDMAALFSKTRCPMSKKWEVVDPVAIAEEMAYRMIELHGLNTTVVATPDPYGDRFDYTSVADEVMLSKVMEELAVIGLKWSVVAGTLRLGPMSRTAVAVLSERDFVGEGLTLDRDGSSTYNDVLLRGADNIAKARVPMGGLTLQTVVDIDSMFGVSNADKAVRQYARHVSRLQDTVAIPDTATLHPHAPVTLDMLIPTSRFNIGAYNLVIPMELASIKAAYSSDDQTVGVVMSNVDDDIPELLELQEEQQKGGGFA